jgi:hypothetical protein
MGSLNHLDTRTWNSMPVSGYNQAGKISLPLTFYLLSHGGGSLAGTDDHGFPSGHSR